MSAPRRHVDVVLAGVLAALHLIATGLAYLKIDHGGAGDWALAFVQALGRGALFLGGFLLLVDGAAGRARWLRPPLAGLVLFLFASEIVDFLLFSLSGTHLTYVVRVAVSGGLRDLVDLIVATRVSTLNLAWMFGLVPLLIVAGAALSRVTARASRRFDVPISRLGWLVALGVAVVLGEQLVSRSHKDRKFYEQERETFAYYLPIIPPLSKVRYPVEVVPVRDERLDEPAVAEAARAPRPAAGRHVFVFVLESVRESFVDATTAPNLTRFGEENLRFRGHSSANATVNSWHSIFHGQHAFYWFPYTRRATFAGAVPVRMLKALGYRVALVTSSDLDYHRYDRSIFGDGYALVDVRRDTSKTTLTKPAEGDREALSMTRELVRDIARSRENTFTAVFLESGHHDYYWPADEPPRFTPYLEKFDYTRVRYPDSDLELVRNRYRNAIHFLDRHVGEVLDAMRAEGVYDDSIIVFVGDHGEEFMEHGRLVHSSNLFEPQTTPVLMMRLPGVDRAVAREGMSHTQIMPTVLAQLGLGLPAGLFDGLPAGAPGAGALQLVCKARIPSYPSKFVLHAGDKKLFFELDALSPERSRWVYLTDVTDADDRELRLEPGAEDALFGPALGTLPFLRIKGPLTR
ncbi:MAG: sulfatase-like hydrolase/transferase [Polyangiaceae bacterium]|nr:sulfatase-like hydrolase/transferase [Polyangiaceae bacterium]